MKIERKINNVGGTLYFSLPRDWIEAHNVKVNDRVIITYGPDDEMVVKKKK